MSEFLLDTSNPVAWFVWAIVGGLGLWALYAIYWHLTYRYEYSETMIDKGIVTDMDYEAPHFNAATKTTSPEEHNVYIKFETMGEQDFDHERLYQTVRIDDKVKAEYRERYRVRKDKPSERVFSTYIIDAVITRKKRRVELD